MATVNRDELGQVEDREEPILFDGQRLDQAAFHELYLQAPKHFRAELIEGVVHVASPVFYPHSFSHAEMVGILKFYSWQTPGTGVMSDGTTKLDQSNELQPDAALLILPEFGGRTTLDAGRFVVGCPELVVEISDSSLPIDLGRKKRVYEASGALEYVVVDLQYGMLFWFRRMDGRWADLPVGLDGVYRSNAFPGLWLDALALLGGDDRGLTDALSEGLASPEHAAFVAEIGRRPANRP